MVMLGTKRPSMTSTCTQSQPASSIALTCTMVSVGILHERLYQDPGRRTLRSQSSPAENILASSSLTTVTSRTGSAWRAENGISTAIEPTGTSLLLLHAAAL